MVYYPLPLSWMFMWKASVQLKAKLNVAAVIPCEKVCVFLWGLVGVGVAFFSFSFSPKGRTLFKTNLLLA